LGSELLRIGEQSEITPHSVVAAAQDPGSPLHSQFTWDDAIAGAKYRLIQANRLIQAVILPDLSQGQRLLVHVKEPCGSSVFVDARLLPRQPAMYQLAVAESRQRMLAAIAALRKLEGLAPTSKQRQLVLQGVTLAERGLQVMDDLADPAQAA
jgi:hypothetical protein